MSVQTRTNEYLRDPEVRRVFEEELLFGEATDTIAGLLESLNLKQKELAERLGVSPGRVSQMLSGGENLTLRTLASIGWSLGIRFDLHPKQMDDRVGTPAFNDPDVPSWLSRLPSPPQYSLKALPKPPEKSTYPLRRLLDKGELKVDIA